MLRLERRKHRRGLGPRPTGARSAPVDAFLVKSEDSVPEEVHYMTDYMHFVTVWLDFLDYPDNSLSILIPAVFNTCGRPSF